MIKKLLLFLFLFSIPLLALPPFFSSALADDRWACGSKPEIYAEGTKLSGDPTTANRALKLVIHTGGQAKTGSFVVDMKNTSALWNSYVPILSNTKPDENGNIVVEYFDSSGKQADPNNRSSSGFPAGTYNIRVFDLGYYTNLFNWLNLGPGKCSDLNFIVQTSNEKGLALCDIDITDQDPEATPPGQLGFEPSKYMIPGHDIGAKINPCPDFDIKNPMCLPDGKKGEKDYEVTVKDGQGHIATTYSSVSRDDLIGSDGTTPLLQDLGPFNGGNYLLSVRVSERAYLGDIEGQLIKLNPLIQDQYNNFFECTKQFNIDANGGHTSCVSDKDCDGSKYGKYCLPDKHGALSCQNSDHGLAINPCVQKGNDYICQTAIGAIGTSPGTFAKSVLQLFLGLGGIILLFTIILNGYKFMTSQGDPEKVKEAREAIIAAITGLLVIIFSIVILQLITIDIFHLPGFKP